MQKHLIKFNENIFPLSFDRDYKPAPHISNWCSILQDSPRVCILAPRKHAKSFSIYCDLMWDIFRFPHRNLEILYLSFTKPLAAYHLRRLKELIEMNPFFKDIKNLTPAEGIIKYTWDGIHTIRIEPDGILSFKRGRHPDKVVLDDILSDPTTMLDLSVIMKINQRVFEDVFSLPKEGGEIKIVGTLQTSEDFMLKLKDLDHWKNSWGFYPAIISDNRKEVLWPELFPYERLMEIKSEIGEKAFLKEYMLQPVYTAEAYFNEIQINGIINTKLSPMKILKTNNDVVAAWDIGKKSHPSHITIFEIMNGIYVQKWQIFLDRMDYTKQVELMNDYQERYGFDKCYFDNTRGEMEGFWERSELERGIFVPCTFTRKMKHKLAANFEKFIVNKKVQLLDDRRQKRQILNCTNDLESIQTVEGHGDSFWSIAMALGGRIIDEVPEIQPLNKEFMDSWENFR